MNSYQVFLLFSTIATFLLLQSGCISPGNRQFSMHYESYNLIKKEGFLKIIYFKPKHFHRYSIWEVLFFLISYIQLIVFLILFAISFYIDIANVCAIASFSFMILSVLCEFARVIYIDISRRIEEKNMKFNEKSIDELNVENKIIKSIFSYSQTIRFQIDSQYKKELENLSTEDYEIIDAIDKKYINYYRNYKDISFVNGKIAFNINDKTAIKNKNVIHYDIECVFFSGKRTTLPDLNSGRYMPHLVIKGTKEYLGIIFESSSINDFDLIGEAKIRSIYDIKMYENLKEKTEFTIREGNKIVGEGKVILVNNKL